ncbi:MAG: 3',5'-cyclic-nucleotide phosphodiesterase [bacterium]
MKIKVIGCYGARLPQYKLTSFLIEDKLLLDAGEITSTLSLEEQTRIKNILVSHAHLDHIKDIFFLADNIFGLQKVSINVYSTSEVITAIKKYVSNNIIWPDFSRIKVKNFYTLNFNCIEQDKEIVIDNFLIKPIRVNHPVPTFGYLIKDDQVGILYTSDTSYTDKIWEEANQVDSLKAIIIDVSFPNRLKKLAEISGHLTPDGLKNELSKISKLDNIYILTYHMKPQYLAEIESEIKEIGSRNILMLEQDKTYIINAGLGAGISVI